MVGMGSAKGSCRTVTTGSGTLRPQPPQKRLPAASSFPHLVQNFTIISSYRISALGAEIGSCIERLAAMLARMRRIEEDNADEGNQQTEDGDLLRLMQMKRGKGSTIPHLAAPIQLLHV